jgi:hypothetical protein
MSTPSTTISGAASPPMASTESARRSTKAVHLTSKLLIIMKTFIRSPGPNEQKLRGFFAVGNFPIIVLTAGTANMMRAFQLAAIGTFLVSVR